MWFFWEFTTRKNYVRRKNFYHIFEESLPGVGILVFLGVGAIFRGRRFQPRFVGHQDDGELHTHDHHVVKNVDFEIQPEMSAIDFFSNLNSKVTT
jgi:hypothetical protein